jgi:hypothetical protein
MRTFSLLVLFFLVQYGLSAQVINNLVVFSNEGEKFTLILNGEKQNPFPVSKVRVFDLTLEVYKVTILFENRDLKTHNTTLTFFGTNNECHFALNRRGRKHSMDYVTSNKIIPVVEEPEENQSPSNTNSDNSNNDGSDNSGSNSNSIPDNSSNGGNTDVTINTKNGGIGIGNNGVSVNTHGVNVNLDPKNKSTNTSVNVLGKDISITKSLKTGCKSSMATLEFNESFKSVTKQTGDTLRMIEAEKIITNNCLQTSQVREILGSLKSDLSKLKMAKMAYSHTSDLNNYGKLEDSFESEDGKRDLKNFIKSQD